MLFQCFAPDFTTILVSGIVDKGIVAKVLWIIALTKVSWEIAGTKTFVVKITTTSIV